MHQCANCLVRAFKPMILCSQCNITKYCSIACQSQHTPMHHCLKQDDTYARALVEAMNHAELQSLAKRKLEIHDAAAAAAIDYVSAGG